MSSIVYLKNKYNGRTYAYLNESVWDSEKKKCRCKRKCLGHIDPETGEIVPNKRGAAEESVNVRSVGATLFLMRISDSIGLTDAVKEALQDYWKLFMSCVLYVAITNDSLSNLAYWSVDNETPFGKRISYKDISDLLDEMDMNTRFRFFREWRDRFEKEDFTMMYTSSVTSLDRKTETIRFNDLPLLNIEQRTDLAFTLDSDTMMPVSYQSIAAMPHSCTDIRRSETEELWLEYSKVTKILDTSFYSQENLSDLLRLNERFLMQVPIDSKLARDSVERVRARMMDLQYSIEINGEDFFAMSFLHYFEGRKCFMHIYFSIREAENEFSLFLDLIENCKKELKNNVFVSDHSDFYNKYFLISDVPGGRVVEENGDAIMSYNSVAGFIVLVSNTVKNAKDALSEYMMRARIQRNFENLKNERDRKLLKLDDSRYDNRLFIQFCAMILYREVRRRSNRYSIIKDLSFSEIMREMDLFKRISIPGFDSPFFTNMNNTQSKIMKAFDIDPKELR